jgi:Protein of unknown function (DUF2971)
MVLPPLYKYLDIRGAKLTLGNGTFKHSKPSDFNDIEDLTIQNVFPEEIEAALTKLSNGFTDIILEHLDDQPTCSSPMREKIAVIQHVYRTNPKAPEIVKAGLSEEGANPIYDVEYMRERSKAFIREINNFMQDYRVLCVTTHIESEQMWSNYAENHAGIVLRIEPNVAKDSKFQLFRPVVYCEKRPSLHDDALDFIARSLFGDQEAWRREILDKIVYTKTLQWQHEAEYRLAIPISKSERPWNVLKYHPEEITELYLGLAMTKENKEDIVSRAKVLNTKIAIFQMDRDANRKLTFNRI